MWFATQHFFSFLQMSNCLSFSSGLRLGRRLQAADGPGAGSEELPRLQRKRWLSGHHSDLSPPSTTHSAAQPDAALHWLSGQPRLPRPRPSRGDSQPDRRLYWSKRPKHWVLVSAGWCCEGNSAGGHRCSPVFSWNFGEGKTTQKAQTPRHSNRLIVIW